MVAAGHGPSKGFLGQFEGFGREVPAESVGNRVFGVAKWPSATVSWTGAP